jgi:hypothetical protein
MCYVKEDAKEMEDCSGYSRFYEVLLRESGEQEEEEKSVGELPKETNIMEGEMKWDKM